MNTLFSRKNLPILVTAAILVLLFGAFSAMFPNFLSLRVVANLFTSYAHIGVIAVGMTFVILSGGIDLSVGSVLGFTTILIASLVGEHGMHPLPAIGIALMAGALFGTLMGVLIQHYELPPFLVTLAGMFLARGLAFIVSNQSMGISHDVYQSVVDFAVPLGGRASLRAVSVIFIGVFLLGIVLAHFTRFGRNVYAIGGSTASALLMGLPVAATRVWVYTLSGFCAALGGVVFTFQTQSGNATNGLGMELDAIAAVVIGGTLLSGGVGYLAGTLMGVLIYGTILTAISFDGSLDSSWQRIMIGALLLLFIGIQRFLTRGAALQRSH